MRIALALLLIAFYSEAQIKTYKLGELEDPALAGSSIAVSPRNPKNIFAYASGRMYASNDGGITWKQSSLQFPADLKGTPNVVTDVKGNLFVVYSTLAQIVSHHSTDDGKTWSEPVVISTTTGKDQYDVGVVTSSKKEEMIVSWTVSSKVGSEADTCKSNIMLSTSGNGGKRWSKPILVNQKPGNCIDDDLTLRGSTPILGADGKMFIVWAGNDAMFYDRSYDGNMWISTDLAIAEQVGGWAQNIPGFGKIADVPSVTIDNSASRIHGTLFLVYSDLKAGENDGDVWLMRSVNRGDNWTVAARINQDKPGSHQFLPRICIDPSTGYVYILYYDRRDYDDSQTDVYLAWSTDGGNQFKEKKISDKPFVADIDGNTFTDYLDISAQKGVVAPVWTVSENGKQQVWTAVFKHEELTRETPK